LLINYGIGYLIYTFASLKNSTELLKFSRLPARFFAWRSKRISDPQFIILLSIIIGILVGFAAIIIKNLVHLIQIGIQKYTPEEFSFLYILYPSIGILIVVFFVKYINRSPVQHGIPSVLYAIGKNNGIIRRHNLYSSIITSSLTVGFGGSVGLEGPTVGTGAAIGSNLGRMLRLSYKQIFLLLGCASAGAMAAIFKAPIAAIVFALEVIVLDLTMSAIVPLLISSATAALTSYFFLGQNVLYRLPVKEEFNLDHLIFYIILGFITGFVSLYFTRIYKYLTRVFDGFKNPANRFFTGAVILGLLIFLFPSLYGEGYEVINRVLSGDFTYLYENTIYEQLNPSIFITILLMVLLIIFKAFATTITFKIGGVGGIFAPTLFLGANTGLLFAFIMHNTGTNISMSNFALVGMAGAISGVIHAPLTAIFLIAEITGGYQLFMPLMIVATISYATVRFFEKNSVYTFQLAKRGELITHHKDRAVLMRLQIHTLIETDFKVIHPEDTLGDLVKVITHAHRNIFPVVDEENNFKGIVKMDDIRTIMFNHEAYNTTFVHELMITPQFTIEKDESMEEVARKFQVSGRYNIAVLDGGKYKGFISRARLFSAYRRLLKEFSEE